MSPWTSKVRIGAAMVALAVLSACNMDVTNPEVIDAETLDPGTDLQTFSLSAQTNLFTAFDDVVVFGALFSGEGYSGYARRETNEIASRTVNDRNVDLNSNIWAPLSLALASSERVRDFATAAEGPSSDLSLARAAMVSGFALVLLAEHFCEVVITGSAPLTPQQGLDSAIVRFDRAISLTAASSGTDADAILNAARVGLARSHLQRGNYAQAIQAVTAVPSTFTFAAARVDDPSSRGRLGNTVFQYTDQRILVVPPDYRAQNDPRVPWQDAGVKANDGILQFYAQSKFTGYGSPIRLASSLEARYIDAEARLKQGSGSTALALISERRAANSQAAYVGSGDAELLTELMNQRARDFFLEGKHMGDVRRNPAAAVFVPPSGTPYYKAGLGDFGSATCLPVPSAERLNNPNFPAS